jgi:hypothetical protein
VPYFRLKKENDGEPGDEKKGKNENGGYRISLFCSLPFYKYANGATFY